MMSYLINYLIYIFSCFSNISMSFVDISTTDSFVYSMDYKHQVEYFLDVELILHFLNDIRFMKFLILNQGIITIDTEKTIQKELNKIEEKFNNLPLFIKNKWLYITNPCINISDKKLIKKYMEIQRDKYIYNSLMETSSSKDVKSKNLLSSCSFCR